MSSKFSETEHEVSSPEAVSVGLLGLPLIETPQSITYRSVLEAKASNPELGPCGSWDGGFESSGALVTVGVPKFPLIVTFLAKSVGEKEEPRKNVCYLSHQLRNSIISLIKCGAQPRAFFTDQSFTNHCFLLHCC